MENKVFNPKHFYQSYPQKVIARPGYPSRAVYKSALMHSIFSEHIYQAIGQIETYADIGGCFGFGANSMAFQISKRQDMYPKTSVFEISSDFISLGSSLFPGIEFIQSEFGEYNGSIKIFDLVTLFDVVEHIVNPEKLLKQVASRSKYVMLITPLETTGDLFGSQPPSKQGEEHPDGHVNFFTPEVYENLLQDCSLEIIHSRLEPSIVPAGSELILLPEQPKPRHLLSFYKTPKILILKLIHHCPGISWRLKRKILGGGVHLALCKSSLHT